MLSYNKLLGRIDTSPVYSTFIKLWFVCQESPVQLGKCECLNKLWSVYKYSNANILISFLFLKLKGVLNLWTHHANYQIISAILSAAADKTLKKPLKQISFIKRTLPDCSCRNSDALNFNTCHL